MSAPTTPAEFDRAYRAPLTPWGDVRVPVEVKALAGPGVRTLELGCGLGRFSRWLAAHGAKATAVDFSSVAIDRARATTVGANPDYRVADVTSLELGGPFDASFDVGCFHCLDEKGQRAYVEGVARLLPAGATHLVWALDASPSDLPLSPDAMRAIFAPRFELARAAPSRRRVLRSHWYWLTRR